MRQFRLGNTNDALAFRRDLQTTLTVQFKQTGKCETLIISSEHFHSSLRSRDAIRALKSFLNKWVDSYRIIVLFRRQDRVAVSLNSTLLKSGSLNAELTLPRTIEEVPRYYK